jgi:transcription-repair coupling factor (superfamily II helicase)
MIKEKYTKIIDISSKFDYINRVNSSLDNSNNNLSIKSLSGSLKAITVASLWNERPRSFLIICPNRTDAESWYHDLNLFVEDGFLALLTEPEKHVRMEADKLDDKLVWLVDGLSLMMKQDFSIAITTPDIFTLSLPEPNYLNHYNIELNIGDTIDYDRFIKDLLLNGFEKKDYVESQGDIAVRGGILDIFPVGWDNPFRMELWGDEIESMREFNTLSQRSISTHDKIEFIANVFQSSQNRTETDIRAYLSPDTIIIADSPELIHAEEEDFELPTDFRNIVINAFGAPDIKINSVPQPAFMASVKEFTNELRSLAAIKAKIVLSADSKIHMKRFREIIESSLENAEPSESEVPLASPDQTMRSIIWLEESFAKGFILEEFGLACFTEHELFGRQKVQEKRRGKRHTGGITLREVQQLNIGDYVVHSDKGVGRFDGFETTKIGGSLQDCVRIRFAGEDLLYVHLNYIHKIQKYSAQEGVVPKLTKLGSADWIRKKTRAKKRLKDIARDLIKLYAQRKAQPGIEYPPDDVWQKEFEASFIYEDTPDQERSTQEVKNDMMERTPMDRLVCGDVGFGKTEIAIRAAFKAVQSGRQVAVLVPTTILAQQHYMTFIDRFNRFPVMVDVISRFRSTKEQKEILEKTANGKLDILIGTHRLLSKDIKFRDLGLLIIDEEQRFGVGAKEKLRQLRANVDTLTLTATPIPRTLNFSLMGARDLSVIETPPRNRIPIITEINEWKNETIVEAILNEIKRGGQVFFVNDKVMNLEKITMDLTMLMPKVRFGIAHGQMKTQELEKVMQEFISKKFDVLVTTKIVESGLDIPNANTMIINRADHFGLAELYQLRGRVGRSNVQAYCYLIIPPVKTLPTKTLRRLQAIEEFTELGSGFQLAMRDMEIRGAGNLLGPEQSGYINDIGFELYQKILDEAVYELRTEEFADIFKDPVREKAPRYLLNEDIAIEIEGEAMIPKNYISSEADRFHYYKQLYNLRSNKELDDILTEMKDRYGNIPEKAKDLLFVVRLRIATLNTGVQRVILKNGYMMASLPDQSNEEFYEKAFPDLIEHFSNYPEAKINQHKSKLSLQMPLQSRDQAVEFFYRMKNVLEMKMQ